METLENVNALIGQRNTFENTYIHAAISHSRNHDEHKSVIYAQNMLENWYVTVCMLNEYNILPVMGVERKKICCFIFSYANN